MHSALVAVVACLLLAIGGVVVGALFFFALKWAIQQAVGKGLNL